MPSLVLELKQGELMVLNGAQLRFRTKATIELLDHARFLFGKQLMDENDAVSPAQKIYYALQRLHLSGDWKEDDQLPRFQHALTRFTKTSVSDAASSIVSEIRLALEGGDSFAALKLARRLIREEAPA